MKPLIYFKRWCDGSGHWLCRERAVFKGLRGMGVGSTPSEAYKEWERLNKWA